jgi:hypothetical protein
MEDGNVNEFLNSITYQDTAVLFQGKRYCFNPMSPCEQHSDFIWDIYIWSGKHGEEEIPVASISGSSVDECMQKFLAAPLWDGKTFWQAQKEMTWVDW